MYETPTQEPPPGYSPVEVAEPPSPDPKPIDVAKLLQEIDALKLQIAELRGERDSFGMPVAISISRHANAYILAFAQTQRGKLLTPPLTSYPDEEVSKICGYYDAIIEQLKKLVPQHELNKLPAFSDDLPF